MFREEKPFQKVPIHPENLRMVLPSVTNEDWNLVWSEKRYVGVKDEVFETDDFLIIIGNDLG